MEHRIRALKYLSIGWVNSFELTDMKERVAKLDEWIRRKLRMCIWKQWRKIRTRHGKLVLLGIENSKAWEHANTRKGYWYIAGSPVLNCTLTNEYLAKSGFVSLSSRYSQVRSF